MSTPDVSQSSRKSSKFFRAQANGKEVPVFTIDESDEDSTHSTNEVPAKSRSVDNVKNSSKSKEHPHVGSGEGVQKKPPLEDASTSSSIVSSIFKLLSPRKDKKIDLDNPFSLEISSNECSKSAVFGDPSEKTEQASSSIPGHLEGDKKSVSIERSPAKNEAASTSGCQPNDSPPLPSTSAPADEEESDLDEEDAEYEGDYDESGDESDDESEDDEESEDEYRNMIPVSKYNQLSEESKKMLNSLIDLAENLNKRIEDLEKNEDYADLSNTDQKFHDDRLKKFRKASELTCDRIMGVAGIQWEDDDSDQLIDTFTFRGSGLSDLDKVLTLYTRRWIRANLDAVRRGKRPVNPLNPATVQDIMNKLSVKRYDGKSLTNEKNGRKLSAQDIHHRLHGAVAAHREVRFNHQTISKFATDQDLAGIPKDEHLEKKFQSSSIGIAAMAFADDYEKQKQREGFKVSHEEGDQGEVVETSSDEDENALECQEEDGEKEAVVEEKEGVEKLANKEASGSGLMTDDESEPENKKAIDKDLPRVLPRSSLKRTSSPSAAVSLPKLSKY